MLNNFLPGRVDKEHPTVRDVVSVRNVFFHSYRPLLAFGSQFICLYFVSWASGRDPAKAGVLLFFVPVGVMLLQDCQNLD